MTVAEHRAAARIAWRSARRAKGRTVLVLLLVAIPIAALAGAGIIITSALGSPQEKVTNGWVGTADMIVVPNWQPGTPPTAKGLERLLPAGSSIVTTTSQSVFRLENATLTSLDLRESSVPADHVPVAPLYQLLRGRMPLLPHEATLTPNLARFIGAGLGHTFDLDATHRHFLLVGLAVAREQLNDRLVLVGPGTLSPSMTSGIVGSVHQLFAPPDGSNSDVQTSWLVTLPRGASPSAAEMSIVSSQRFGVQTRDELLRASESHQQRLSGLSLAVAVVALFGTGLIAAAALGVGARRQLRTLGLVGATGGEPRHVRAIVLWGGTLPGAVGSVLGLGVAVLAAPIVLPHLDAVVNRVVGGMRVPWWSIVGGLALGTAASTVAATSPARHAARVSVTDALAGRLPAPQAPGKTARRGLIAIVGGGIFVIVATMTHEMTLLAIALVVTVSGFLLTIPLLVAWVGRGSRRGPAVLRLGGRLSARYARRTGAAVAAATLALAAPVAVGAYTLSNESAVNHFQALAQDQMMLQTYDPSNGFSVPTRILDAARAAMPGSAAALVRNAVYTKGTADPSVAQSIGVKGPEATTPQSVGSGEFIAEIAGVLLVADAELLRAAHGEAGLPYVNGSRIIALGEPVDHGVLHVDRITPATGGDVPMFDIPAVSVPLSRGAVDPTIEGGATVPHFLIPPALAARYGIQASSVAPTALFRAPQPLSREDIARVKHAIAAIPGAYAQTTNDLKQTSASIRLEITGAAIGLALVIVAIAVALVGAESRRERAILSAVGAAPGYRRRLAGANAFLLTASAGLLAIPTGFVPAALIDLSRRASYPILVPWSIVGLVALGAPALAGLLAALTSREPKAHVLLQPVW